MKTPSPATRRQLYLLAALAAVLILAVVKWGGKGSSGASRAAASRVAGPAAPANPEEDRPAASHPRPRSGKEKSVSPEDVPFISVEDLNPPRARGTGASGRNIFDLRAPTLPPPPTPTKAPPPPPGPGSTIFVGPLAPPAPTPTPVPPDITFKFIGTFGPRDGPIAVLVLGDQLLNAHAGDVIFDRFILRNIGYESVDVGFVGYSPAVTKRLAITP
jgi:pyruvate/2-oxoglutarate dehydrogenase complex dihydrolipoamide acyltransferase (E2) component